MMNGHAYANNEYKNNQVMTAPRKKLLIMLYDGAIKNLKLAKISFETKDTERINKYLIKAQDIIIELMTTLNFEFGGQIAESLYSLYEYLYNRLVRANIDKDEGPIEEVIRFLEELRDTWAKI